VSELEILRSPLLTVPGVIHGWPTRHGGVSSGARSSLNLGVKWGDSQANVDENRRRVAQAAGYAAERLRIMRHNHGIGVHVWQTPELEPPEAFDGHLSARPGEVMAAFAADCIPMLMLDPVRGVVGAAHAGWRGTVNGVGVAMVRTMVERYGSEPAQIRIALGPSIGVCCFEVGDEVADEFSAKLGAAPGLVVRDRPRPHVDLRVATRLQLERIGIAPEHLDDTPPCTRCNPDRFFSYRRDAQTGGIHMAFIGTTSVPRTRQ
jgi:YfiH family protein